MATMSVQASTHAAEVYEAVACLQRLATAFEQRREQLARAVGLSEHQWAVLEEISTEHFVPSMFARTQASSAAAVSKTLRQLLNKGLVSASLSSTDARQRDYVLTARGKKIMAALRDERQRAIDTIWFPLDRKDLKTFVVLNNLVAARIEDYANHDQE